LASKTLQTLPKEEEEEEEHNRVVGLGQILCSLLALHQIFRQLERERLEKITAAASSFITWRFVQPIKTVPTQKTQENKKGTTKTVKISPLHHSLYLHQKQTQKHPQILQNKKQSQKPQKHTQLPQKLPPPPTKISSKRMYVQNFLNTLLHLPFATITHQNSQTHQNQSIDLHSKKEEEGEEEKGNKTHKELKDRREKRERERESLTRVYTRSI
jgi:hypothetical protein